MSPYDKIVRLYEERPAERAFSFYLDWHLAHGFVFNTPEFFIMGRPVRRSAGDAAVCEPTRLFTREESDCWMIHAMAGDCVKAWSILPWPLGWIAFERTRGGKRELQCIPTERIRHLCGPFAQSAA